MDTNETKKSLAPKFSIIIPFFNSESTLKRAVDSVISQSVADWELILVNDGSIDQSDRIAKSYLEDQRVSYFYQENKGVSAARNLGASKAMADWLIFLDSDDKLKKEILSVLIDSILIFPKHNYFYYVVELILKSGKRKIKSQKSLHKTKLAGSFTIKKQLFFEIDGYDERLRFSENTELLFRLKQKGFFAKFISYVGLEYYQSSNGGSRNLVNIKDGLLFILKKHDSFLSRKQKFNYNQTLAVIFLRNEKFKLGRIYFLKAIMNYPFDLRVYIRFMISLFPSFSRFVYSSSSNG